ncbi:MAG: hypothetical protein SNJ53_02980, partial [Thermodesulfovibrionales bacterium]
GFAQRPPTMKPKGSLLMPYSMVKNDAIPKTIKGKAKIDIVWKRKNTGRHNNKTTTILKAMKGYLISPMKEW